MQDEFDAMDNLPVDIKIIGLNEIGEGTKDSFVEERDLPWLQDNEEEMVWLNWNIRYRDLLILDTENRSVALFNLSGTDLRSSDYDIVKAKFIELANEN